MNLLEARAKLVEMYPDHTVSVQADAQHYISPWDSKPQLSTTFGGSVHKVYKNERNDMVAHCCGCDSIEQVFQLLKAKFDTFYLEDARFKSEPKDTDVVITEEEIYEEAGVVDPKDVALATGIGTGEAPKIQVANEEALVSEGGNE